MGAIKSYFAELLGTFILVFIGTGAVVTALTVGNGLTVAGLILISLTFGLTLSAIIYALGEISGAHVNPAVTVGAWVSGNIHGRHVIPYIIFQLFGALLASFFIILIVGTSFGIGANTVGVYGEGSALLVEIILTMLFVVVIFLTAKEGNNHAALAIGFFLVVAHLFAIPISGSSLNPARSFGPALLIGGLALNQLWIYIVGPLIGAIFGAIIVRLVEFGRR